VRHNEAVTPHMAGPNVAIRATARRQVAFLAVIAVLAIPMAWLIATLGFTIRVAAPGRDIALLLLWSASEEVVFRGGLLTLLSRRPGRSTQAGRAPPQGWRVVSAANLLTSLVFCAAHAPFKPALVVLGLFPVSLLLGASLERTGRLWVPVALHGYFNLLLYAASALTSA